MAEQLKIAVDPPAMKLKPVGQVVSYDWARAILYDLGCGCRRDGDYLVVFKETALPCHIPKNDDENYEPIGTLYIDEGFWNNVQEFGGECVTYNQPYREYMDMTDLAKVILSKLSPEKSAECHGGPYMGRGRRKRNEFIMIAERLRELGYWAAKGEENAD